MSDVAADHVALQLVVLKGAEERVLFSRRPFGIIRIEGSSCGIIEILIPLLEAPRKGD